MVKELDADTIAKLLSLAGSQTKRKRDIYQKPQEVPTCHSCNSLLDNGYCRNELCPIDQPVETYPCDICGHCPNPNKCVASVLCIRCSANPGEHCSRADGSVTWYHEERWLTVRRAYGVYYK